MKNYIVRAPQTDRLLVPVPTNLVDLTDTLGSLTPGTGSGFTTASATVEPLTTKDLPLGSYSGLAGTESDGSGNLRILVPGLYLIITTIKVNMGGLGSWRRSVAVKKNAAVALSWAVASSIDTYATTDQFSGLLRLVANDIITPVSISGEGLAYSVVSAGLEVIKVAI